MNLTDVLQSAKIVLPETQKMALTANLRSLGYDPNSLGINDALVVYKLVSALKTEDAKPRPNPITASVNRITAQENLLCPICKNTMTDIKIHGGRDAMYCVEHHIALPIEAKQG